MSDTGNPAGTGTGTGSTQGSGQGTPPAWFAALDAEHVGHIQTRGWDKLDPAVAAQEAVKGHVAASRMLGVPQEQLLRLPKDAADSDGWRNVWQRLGAPKDAKDYNFEGVDLGDSGTTNSFMDAMRQTAAAANMPVQTAAEVAKGFQKWLADRATSYDTEVAANVAAADKAIKENWGKEHEHFSYIAKQGREALAARLGERLGPQLDAAFNLLREQGFGELAAELGRVAGAGLGEDRSGGGSGSGGSGPAKLTVEMAQARLAELSRDTAWAARRMAGDTDAAREFAMLIRTIAGEG